MVRNVNYTLVILFLIFFHFYFYHTNIIQRLDLRFYDLLSTFINKKSIGKYSDNSTVLVNIVKKPQVISLSDIINGKTPFKDIQGKTLLIGLSIIISNNEKISNTIKIIIVMRNFHLS